MSPATARGERSIALENVNGVAIAITGDGNRVSLIVNSEEAGDLLELLKRSERGHKQRHPVPLLDVPPPFANHLDRDRETDALLALAGGVVNLHGDRGLGKTYLLRHALARPAARALRDGVVYLHCPDKRYGDILQELFEAFYDCEPPRRPTDIAIRRDLRECEALVVVDGVELEPFDAQQLASDVAHGALIVASRPRVLADYAQVALTGLATVDAVELIAQERDRPVSATERSAAETICEALGGHPLKIRQAAACLLSLREIAAIVTGPDGEQRLAGAIVAGLSAAERDVLAGVALFRGAPVGIEHLAAITDQTVPQDAVERLEAAQIVVRGSARYRLAGGLTAYLLAEFELAAYGERAVEHFDRWMDAHRERPGDVLVEAPAVLRLIEWGQRRRRRADVIRLGRGLDAALAAGRRWGIRSGVLAAVLDAARESDADAAVAWALHQQGTQAFCLGDAPAAAVALRRALELRERAGDEGAAAVTRANLRVVAPPPPWFSRLSPPAALLTVLVLAVGGALLMLLNRGGDGATAVLEVVKQGTGGAVVSTLDRDIEDCPLPCRARVRKSAEVTIALKPDRGTRFLGWSGAGCSGRRDCTLRLPARVSARLAAAPRTRPLQVRLSGGGEGRVTSDPVRIDCPGTCEANFARGSSVQLTQRAAPGSEFRGWSGSCGDGECAVVMSQPRAVSARFERLGKTRKLTVRVPTGGRVTGPAIRCPSTCSTDVADGETVVLRARAHVGWRFSEWSDACSGSAPRCAVTMSEDRTVAATFEEVPLATLTITPSGDGSGTVTSEPEGIDCGSICAAKFPVGDEVTLTATANAGSSFPGWLECQGQNPCTLTLDADRTLSPVFDLGPYDLTIDLVNADDPHFISIVAGGATDSCEDDCTRSFANRTDVMVSVSYRREDGRVVRAFPTWEGCDEVLRNTCRATMDHARTVTARFSIVE